MLLPAALSLVAFWNPAPKGWISDFNLALARAQNENKFVFADFTGSDWCEFCHKLDSEILDTDEFKAWADKNVILLQLDYPHEKELPYAIAYQNDAAQKQYGSQVEGFPTVLLLTGRGQIVAKIGYDEHGPTPWIASLDARLTEVRKIMKEHPEAESSAPQFLITAPAAKSG